MRAEASVPGSSSVDYASANAIVLSSSANAAVSPIAVGFGAGVGSLLGNLIVTSINNAQIKHAGAAMQPVSQELVNFDVVNYFKTNLNDELERVKWLKISTASLAYNTNNMSVDKIVKQSKENATFLAQLTYKLNYHLNALMMNAYVELDQKNPSKHSGYDTLYYNNFTFIYYLPKEDKDRTSVVNAWSQHNSKMIKSILQQGTMALTKQIVQDIENPNINLYAVMKDQKVLNFRDDYQAKMTGKLIGMSNNFYVLRLPDDTVYIVNGDALTS